MEMQGAKKMTVYIDKKIKIDRIKFGGLGITFEHFLVFKELTSVFKTIKPETFNNKNISTTIDKYLAAITFKTQKNKMVLRIQAGSSLSSFCYVTWEFICKNIKNSNVHQFIEIIELLMGNIPAFTYKVVSQVAKIKYLELACDLLTGNIHKDLIFWKPKTKKGTIFQTENNTKGTIKIGQQSSQLHFSIYNKSKQLQEVEKENPLINYTRIEAVIKKTQYTLSELINLKSPFAHLHIADVGECRKRWQEPEWLEFIENSLEHTYPVAISSIDKKTRKIFQDRLKECAAKFWKSEFLLSNLSQEIALLQIENIYPNHDKKNTVFQYK